MVVVVVVVAVIVVVTNKQVNVAVDVMFSDCECGTIMD